MELKVKHRVIIFSKRFTSERLFTASRVSIDTVTNCFDLSGNEYEDFTSSMGTQESMHTIICFKVDIKKN